MAARYWIGSNAIWDATNTAVWSADGSSGGASVPTDADDVYINGVNAICKVADGYAASCKSLTLAGGGAFFGIDGTPAGLNIAGNLTIQNGTNWFYNQPVTFSGDASTIIYNAGSSHLNDTSIVVASGTFNLTQNITCKAVTLTGGTFNTANYSFTAGTLATSGSTSRTFNFGSSVITLTEAVAVDFASVSGLTISANTATISINGSGASQSMNFGGASIYTLSLANASATSFRFNGNVTASSVTATRSGSYTVQIDAGKTITTAAWTVSGTAGNIVSLRCSTPDSQGYIVKTGGGTVTTQYMSVKDMNASPSLTFLSLQSEDLGNNTNWFFDAFYKPNTLLYGSPM